MSFARKKVELVSKEMFFIRFSRSWFNLAEEKTRKVAKSKKRIPQKKLPNLIVYKIRNELMGRLYQRKS